MTHLQFFSKVKAGLPYVFYFDLSSRSTYTYASRRKIISMVTWRIHDVYILYLANNYVLWISHFLSGFPQNTSPLLVSALCKDILRLVVLGKLIPNPRSLQRRVLRDWTCLMVKSTSQVQGCFWGSLK